LRASIARLNDAYGEPAAPTEHMFARRLSSEEGGGVDKGATFDECLFLTVAVKN
jgi:hypothetical protein